MRPKIRVSGELVVAAVSVGLMVLGAFGPWVTGPFGISFSGTRAHDGWFIVGAAGVAGIALCLFVSSARRGWIALAVAAGLVGLYVGIANWRSVHDVLSDAQLMGVSVVHIGWGLELGTLASAALLVACVVLLLRTPQRPAQAQPPQVEPPA
jgi:hypothetical protein